MWKLLFPDFARVLFSLFPWLPSTVPSQSSQSSSQVALHVALELASAAFISSWCCPSPVLGPLWRSHRQIIFLLGPSSFGAGFLIVGLTVCSCPAGSRQVEHLHPCSYSMEACLRPGSPLPASGGVENCAVHTVLVVGRPNMEIVLGRTAVSLRISRSL